VTDTQVMLPSSEGKNMLSVKVRLLEFILMKKVCGGNSYFSCSHYVANPHAVCFLLNQVQNHSGA